MKAPDLTPAEAIFWPALFGVFWLVGPILRGWDRWSDRRRTRAHFDAWENELGGSHRVNPRMWERNAARDAGEGSR